LIISALSSVIALAGCASHPAQRESQAEPSESAESADHTSPPRIHRPSRALLTPQPAPDCEFRGAAPKTMDSDVFARLKLDYERLCYKKAERIARERLGRLQASVIDDIEPIGIH
jgi:hypothetical protein